MVEMYVLNELAAFAKYGTLTAVAEKLAVSQPALSRSMKKLENDLGVSLFDRTKNKITLNANGKAAAELAKKVIEAEKNFEEKVVEYERKHRVFNFGSIAPMPIIELAPIISQVFMGMTVKHELFGSEKELYRKLDSGAFRMIVTTKPPKDAEKYSFHRLFEEDLYALLPKNHRLADRKEAYIKEFDGEKFLVYSKIGFWYDVKKKLIPRAEFFDQNDMETLKKLVSLADIPAFATNFSSRMYKVPQNRVMVRFTDPELNVIFYCICLKRNEPDFAALFSQIDLIYG